MQRLSSDDTVPHLPKRQRSWDLKAINGCIQVSPPTPENIRAAIGESLLVDDDGYLLKCVAF